MKIALSTELRRKRREPVEPDRPAGTGAQHRTTSLNMLHPAHLLLLR